MNERHTEMERKNLPGHQSSNIRDEATSESKCNSGFKQQQQKKIGN